MAKKYFWLKLKDDFFQDKRIKKLRRIAGGDTYTVIYLKMQLLSLKNEGILLYEGVEDSFYEEIALEIDEDTDNVKFTILFLQSNGLLEEVDQNSFALIETMNSIGSETQSAERVRRFRDKQKALQCNADVTSGNTEIEIEKDIEKEINKDDDKGPQNDFAQLVKFHEQNIGILYPTTAEHLGYLLDDYKDVALILEALRLAVSNQARNKLKYAETTLKNWKDQLITDLATLKAKEEKQNAKHRSGPNNKPSFEEQFGFSADELG